MDFGQLSQHLWTALQPYLPLLLAEAARETGKRVPAAIRRLWQEVAERLRRRPAGAEALEDLRAAPEDPDAQAAFRLQVKKHLAADPTWAAHLAALLAQAGSRYQAEVHDGGAVAQGPGATAAGERGVVIGGDATGNIIVTGDNNQVRG